MSTESHARSVRLIKTQERVLVALALILFAGVILFNVFTSLSEKSESEVVSRYKNETVTAAQSTTQSSTKSTADDTDLTSVKHIEQKININTASADELQSLTGIGPSKAQAIVDYRNENGLFSNPNELINVSGIGEKTLAKIIDKICV